jgi:leucyl aminopeptidase
MTDFARLLVDSDDAARPIHCVSRESLEGSLAGLSDHGRAWARAHGFTGQAGRTVVLPDASGGVAGVLFGLGDAAKPGDPFAVGKLASELPEGTYAFAGDQPADPRLATLGWLLESYRFDRYRSTNGAASRLVTPPNVDRDEVLQVAQAVALTRDLVNTPAGDLGPAELEAAATRLAGQHGAEMRVITGDELAKGFPLIHTSRAASPRRPRLIDFSWGRRRRER